MGAGHSTSSNAAVNAKGDVAVIAGASQGIGLGLALRFAKANADVWIVARNEQRAKAVIEQLKKAGAPDARYFLADLSKMDDVARVAGEIKAAAGESGISYLFQTQGGAAGPNDNVPGIDPHLAVQVLSRVLLAHELRHTVKRSSVAIAIAGMGGKTFDTEDITLEKLKARGAVSISTMMAIGARDATLLDAAWTELAKDSSQDLQYLHLFPGIVKTNVMANSGQGALLRFFTWLGGLLVGKTVEQYVEVPFFLAANPEGRKLVERDGGFWSEKLKKLDAAPRARDETTRKVIWDWLRAQIARGQ